MLPWDGARDECRKLGGDLAMLYSLADLKLVYTKVTYSDLIWVGGRLNAQANANNFKESFEWLTGERIPYNYNGWTDFEPDIISHDCLSTYKDYKRRDGTKGPALATYGCSS